MYPPFPLGLANRPPSTPFPLPLLYNAQTHLSKLNRRNTPLYRPITASCLYHTHPPPQTIYHSFNRLNGTRRLLPPRAARPAFGRAAGWGVKGVRCNAFLLPVKIVCGVIYS